MEQNNNPQTPSINEPMEPSPQSKLPLIIGGVSLLLAVGVGSYFLGQRSQLNSTTSTNLTTIEPTSTATSPTDTTDTQVSDNQVNNAQTKTYTNNVLKYKAQIDKEWDITEKDGVFIGSKGEAIFLPPSEKDNMGYTTQIAVVALNDTEENKARYNLNTQQQFNEWLSKPISTDEGQRQYKTGQIKVNGFDAIQYVTQALPGDPTEAFYGVITWVRKDNVNYYIEFGGNKEIVQENLNTYNNFISSFQFID